MAEANILGLSCSICLDLCKHPVALPCGHRFCMKCIKGSWDQEDKETQRKHIAIQFCLTCQLYLCGTQPLRNHSPLEFSRQQIYFNRSDKIIKACIKPESSRGLQKQICSQHDILLEVYCLTDQQCICTLCMLDEHKGHDTVSAAAGRAEKQKQLLEMQEKSKQAIEDREKELQKLRKAVETYKHSAQTDMQESVKMFTELIKAVEKRQLEVTQLIRDQEKAALSPAEDIINQLQQEIGELKRRDAKLEKLSRTEDPIQYLQSFHSVPAAPGSANFTTTTHSFSLTFEKLLVSVSQLRDKLETFFISEFKNISPEAQSSEDAEKFSLEKKPTMKERKSLQLPPTYFYGTRRDLGTVFDSLSLADLETEPQKFTLEAEQRSRRQSIARNPLRRRR